MLEGTAGVVDVDWYVASPQPKTALVVDESRRPARPECPRRMCRQLVRLATDGGRAGLLHDPNAREDVPIVVGYRG